MTEIIFLVEEAAEGGYTARALGESIFTEADDLEELERNVRDARYGATSTKGERPLRGPERRLLSALVYLVTDRLRSDLRRPAANE